MNNKMVKGKLSLLDNKKILFAFSIFIITLLIFSGNVKGIDSVNTTGEAANLSGIGDGDWAPNKVGLRVAVLKYDESKGKYVETLNRIFVNESPDSQQYFNYSYNSKIYNSLTYDLKSKNWVKYDNLKNLPGFFNSLYGRIVIDYQDLPSDWYEVNSGLGFYGYLKDQGHLENLLHNHIRKSYFSDYKKKEIYIIAEPMFSIYHYYGTAYEMINSFYEDDAWRKNYSIIFNNWYYQTIYVDNLTTEFGQRITAATEDRIDCIKSKNCGAIMGIFKYSDLINETHSCEVVKENGKTVYYGKNGNTGKTAYIRDCVKKCSYDEGTKSWYNSNKKPVTKEEMEKDCTVTPPKPSSNSCLVVYGIGGLGNIYYGAYGTKVDFSTYKQQCGYEDNGNIKKYGNDKGTMAIGGSLLFRNVTISYTKGNEKYYPSDCSGQCNRRDTSPLILTDLEDFCCHQSVDYGDCIKREQTSSLTPGVCIEWEDDEYYLSSNYFPSSTYTFNGQGKLYFEPGIKYDYRESSSVTGYPSGGGSGKLVGSGYNSITFTNKLDCESEFNLLNPDDSEYMIQRVSLYQRVKATTNNDYTNLLNIDIKDAKTACSKATNCNNTITSGCLSGYNSGSISEFSATNMSCYTETIKDSNGYEGYCGIKFEITNGLANNSFTNKYNFGTINSGRMIFTRATLLNGVIQPLPAATGKIIKTCYVYGPASQSYTIDNGLYKKYVNSVRLGYDKNDIHSNNKLVESVQNATINTTQKGYYVEVKETQSANYSGKATYAENGSGTIKYSQCDTCKLLGYGIVSKFNDSGNKNLTFNFNVSNKLISKEKTGTSEYTSNSCTYTVNKLIPPNSVEFRIIDTENSFPGKSGNGRTKVGTNWRSKDLNITLGLLNTYLGTTVVTTPEQFDLNKDGKIDEIDTDFFTWSQSNYKGESLVAYNNPYIRYIMETTNNSYNKDKETAKYKIKLDTRTIKEIRKYNKENKYDDYTLDCKNDVENCKSTFLEELASGKVNGVSVNKLTIQ